MNCNKCGNEIQENSIFCSKCGEKVNSTFNEVASANEIHNTTPVVSKSKFKMKLIVSISIIFVIALSAGGWFYYDYLQKQEALRIEAQIKAADQKYRDEMKMLSSSLLTNHVKKLDSALNDIYLSSFMMDNLETVNKVTKSLSDFSSDVNSKIISLQDIKVPNDYLPQHNNFIETLNKYKTALEEKRRYIESNKVEIVSYNQLFLKGNPFSVNKTVKFDGDIDKLTNDIKSSVNNLKQRIENLTSKF
ncbi:zinc ribbon domain-containing protein [Paenibacillus sp.]|uniref:zinc ribbon domain-containing protein n=1 Tax=Paenibacillus sp. TaxID=58172 RepID=UPI0035637836